MTQTRYLPVLFGYHPDSNFLLLMPHLFRYTLYGFSVRAGHVFIAASGKALVRNQKASGT
jgi:hypothetical protein